MVVVGVDQPRRGRELDVYSEDRVVTSVSVPPSLSFLAVGVYETYN